MAEPTTFDDRDGWIWLDGKLVPWREASVHVLTHGLHYASSVFEGQRAYGGSIFKLTEHSERLRRSASLLGFELPWSTAEIDAACNEVLTANGMSDAYMRPVGLREDGRVADRRQAAFGDRRLGLGQILSAGKGRAGHPPDNRAVAAAGTLHRSDGIEGGRPLHDLHDVQAACRNHGLR
jgi:hypothetical protein